MNICARHRNELGIGWRGRRKYCQVNFLHKTSKPPKGDKSVDKKHSMTIKLMTSELVPIGSGWSYQQCSEVKIFYYWKSAFECHITLFNHMTRLLHLVQTFTQAHKKL